MCNTHLESLRAELPLRPRQMERVVGNLHDSDGENGEVGNEDEYAAEIGRKVLAGIVAGDMIAIQFLDQTLHVKNGLKDAFLQLTGLEAAEEGWTWGMQSPVGEREKYGPCRKDEVLYCG